MQKFMSGFSGPVILLATGVVAVFLGRFAAWLGALGSGVPMEWPR